jgi:Mat/Ecp fimbriae outer membrane usher protein
MVVWCVAAPVLAQEKTEPQNPADQPIIIKPGVPKGFEILDGPRDTSIDVVYGGLPLGNFRAVYNAKTISFYHPQDIIAKIPDVKKVDEERVIAALTGEISTHTELLCGRDKKEGCNTLTPDIAGVILNESIFRAELFLNPNVLLTQDTHKDKILPPATNVYSSVHGFNAGITGTAGKNNNQQYSLLTNSTFAYGAQRLNVVGIATDEKTEINTMTASLDRWGLDNRLGYFNSRASQLLPQVAMSGVSVGTSTNTNLSLRDAAGSRLTIFLPQRSYVSIVYNGVIYTTDFYEAGNQVLNTDALPDGAYEVTLRIRDNNGENREEKRFFAKSFSIPPEDTPIYYAQAGVIRDIKKPSFNFGTENKGVISQVATVQRLSEAVGVNSSLLLLKDKLFFENGAFLLFPPDHQLRASVLLSQEADTGFGLSYLGYCFDKRMAFSSDLRAIFSVNKNGVIDELDPTSASSKQWSNQLSYQLDNLTSIGFHANFSKYDGTQGHQYSYGPQVRYDFWRTGNSLFSLVADTSQTQDGVNNSIFLQYSRRLGEWGLQSNGGYRKNNASAGSSTESYDGRLTWSDDKTPGKLNVVGMDVRHDGTSDSFGTDYEHRSNLGTLKLLGSRRSSNNTTSNFYSGNAGFSVIDVDDEIIWAGNQQQNSGIVVKNSGNSGDVPMRVMVNNSELTTFNTGASSTLFMTPYQTYNISIQPKASSAIDYDGAIKRVTLYPGNILPMVWMINRINVVLGHVVLPDGTPLVNARLEEARNISVTDEQGLFQGELLELKHMTFVRETQTSLASTGSGTRDADVFSLFPKTRGKLAVQSDMSADEQSQALLDIFGTEQNLTEGNQSVGKKKSLLVAPQAAEKKIQATPIPLAVAEVVDIAPDTLPPVRCRVDLPDVEEVSGVYSYPNPLVCKPIAFEVKPQVEQHASLSPLLTPQRIRPWLKSVMKPDGEFAAALLGDALPNAPDIGIPSGAHTIETTGLAETTAQSPMEVYNELIHLVSSPDSGNIKVQLGAFRQKEQAWQAWDRAVQYTPVLAAMKPLISPIKIADKGTYYRLQIGSFASRTKAKLFCQLLTMNGQSCMLPTNGIRKKKEHPLYAGLKDINDPDFVLPEPIVGVAANTKEEAVLSLEKPPVLKPVNLDVEPLLVQLAALRSEDEAMKQWQEMQQSIQELQSLKPHIIRVNKGKDGVYYRLRVGNFTDYDEAKSFCEVLIAKGQSCLLPLNDPNHKANTKSTALLGGMGGPYTEVFDGLTD